MCTVLYIASDRALELIPRDEARPAFHVTQLLEGEAPIKSHFSKRFINYVGAAHGCSCAFTDWEFMDDYDESGRIELRAEVEPLVAYVEKAVAASGPVEIYLCQDGEWANLPRLRRHLTTADWTHAAFRLESGVFYTIANAGQS